MKYSFARCGIVRSSASSPYNNFAPTTASHDRGLCVTTFRMLPSALQSLPQADASMHSGGQLRGPVRRLILSDTPETGPPRRT